MSVWYDNEAKRYRIRIRRGGQEVRKILPSGITRRQADEKHTDILREFFDQSDLGKRPSYTIADALNRLIEEELPKLRTAHHVKSNIRALLPLVRGRTLSDCGAVAENYRRTAGLADATINRRLAVLRRVCTLAYREWRWLDRPVHIRLLQENNARHEYLDRGEVEILAWLAEAWLQIAGDEALIAAYSGMRRGEIWAVREFDGETATLRDTKNRRPRLVPVIERIRKPLERFMGAERPHPRTVHKAFKRAAVAIGRPDLHFHDLRHTTASLLINAGVDLYTVGKILGHLDTRTTARYAHLTLDKQREAVERIAPGRIRKKAK